MIYIMTLRLKKRNQSKLESGNQTAVDSETEAVTTTEDNPWFIGGLSNGLADGSKGKGKGREYAVGVMLEGYYELMRRGVWIAIFGRTVGSLALVAWILRRYRRRA